MFRLTLVCLILITHVHAAPTPDVSKSLRECNQHLKANRLTSGDGGTALECYQDVLKMEPTNVKALAGLEKIEARYVKWAKRALKKGQKDKAKRYLASLRVVNPQSPSLAEFDAQLQPPSSVASKPSSEPVVSKPPTESVTPSPADKSVTSSKPTESTISQPSTDESATPSSSTKEPPPPPKKVQITNVGQIYELINTTECLTWPSDEMKEKGGKNGWDKFYPKKGDLGMIVKEMKHCHLEDNVYIVEMEQYYVPISSTGAQIMSEEPIPTKEL
jgi:hypothetical protein